jgi:hypothetical protein
MKPTTFLLCKILSKSTNNTPEKVTIRIISHSSLHTLMMNNKSHTKKCISDRDSLAQLSNSKNADTKVLLIAPFFSFSPVVPGADLGRARPVGGLGPQQRHQPGQLQVHPR